MMKINKEAYQKINFRGQDEIKRKLYRKYGMWLVYISGCCIIKRAEFN